MVDTQQKVKLRNVGWSLSKRRKEIKGDTCVVMAQASNFQPECQGREEGKPKLLYMEKT